MHRSGEHTPPQPPHDGSDEFALLQVIVNDRMQQGYRYVCTAPVGRDKGWIHPDDPRGWFQWYCRYFMGRRMPQEDRRQIKRWQAMRRHVRQIRRNCEPGDLSCRRRQRQALLHWAYDSGKI